MDDETEDTGPRYARVAYETPHDRRLRRIGRDRRSIRHPMRTTGDVPKGAACAWVYVATTRRGRVKIGITSNIESRMRSLQARVLASHPVVPGEARRVETAAFQILGHLTGDGEWTRQPADKAMDAVVRAMDEMRRARHIDPNLTADEARRLRVALAMGQKPV